MKFLIYALGLLLVGCTLPEFLGGDVSKGGLPNENTDQLIGWASGMLNTIFGPYGAMGSLGLTTVYGFLKSYNSSKTSKNIVAAVDSAFETADDQAVKVVKAEISKKMDYKTKELIKKIKDKL